MNQIQETKFPKPFYYLIFKVNSESNEKIKSLFTDIKPFLENFPTLRWGGWDLKIGVGGRYKIDVDGIEYVDSTKRVKVFENGSLIIQGALSNDFLCWSSGCLLGGEKDQESIKDIHSLALIEFTYSSFCVLQKIITDIEKLTSISTEIGFVGIDRTFSLRYNQVGQSIPLRKNFSSSNNSFTETYVIRDLSPETLLTTVYCAIVKIYRMFDLSEGDIPYANRDSKIIDVEQIKNTG